MSHFDHLVPKDNLADVRRWQTAIARIVSKRWTIMEVCGGQTHSIMRWGLDTLLPPDVQLVHGPGCPVCVTPEQSIDAAIKLALSGRTTVCTYGDMMRVPGSTLSLAEAKALGGEVHVVTSPLQVLALAQAKKDHEYVFFAVGFETTAPGTAALMEQVVRHGMEHVSVLMAHVRVLPALEMLLSHADCQLDGIIAAGHVCAVTGYHDYHALAQKHGVPVVVTGFDPGDVMRGLCQCVTQLEEGRAEVENAYERVVREDGNERAQALIERYLQVADRPWRGLGVLPQGGFKIRSAYKELDAACRFGIAEDQDATLFPRAVHNLDRGHSIHSSCLASEVLLGRISPTACPHFATRCHPESPLGAPMVSHEGACAAYYVHRRRPESHGISS